jgi:acyl-coenzyme A thioesterase PaaI-like protein
VTPQLQPGAPLPPHQPNCPGCGPRNQAGLHLRCALTEDGVEGRVMLGLQHEGGPGIAHGGIVAAVLDDLFGFLLYRLGFAMVTARLELDYRRPVALDVEYTGVARIDSREGRKVWCTGELLDGDGAVLAQARGLFLRVGYEHFQRAAGERALDAIERWRRAGEEGDAGPGPVGP